MDVTNENTTTEHDPYAALRVRDFRFFMSGNFFAVLGMQMQTAAVAWEMYERTESNIAVGITGLAQFVPVLGLAFFTGSFADRADRRRIMMAALAVIALASLALASFQPKFAADRVTLMYSCLFFSGVARAFQQPARASFLAQVMPRESFSNAVAWNTGAFHLASALGPAVAGLLIAVFKTPMIVYLIDGVAATCFLLLLACVESRPITPTESESKFEELAAGLSFLWRSPIVLGAISLDMFAVLLGGAMTLLPVYASKEILDVGPTGYGWMRAAPAVGAFAMSVWLAYRPPLERAGRALLWSVAGFGVATIVFGLSRSFWLSVAMLVFTGAFDNISVVVRHTLVQVLTPNELRGRVSAVNGLFIGASNELGGFESGLVAEFFTPTISVVSGGIGTIGVVAATAYFFPPLRRYGRLGSPTHIAGSSPAAVGEVEAGA